MVVRAPEAQPVSTVRVALRGETVVRRAALEVRLRLQDAARNVQVFVTERAGTRRAISGTETCIMPMNTPSGVPSSPPSSIPKSPASQPSGPRLDRIMCQAKVRTISPIRKGIRSRTRIATRSARLRRVLPRSSRPQNRSRKSTRSSTCRTVRTTASMDPLASAAR